MEDKIEFKEFDENITSIFSPKSSYTFLVGAGVSMDKPSNVPSAIEIVRNLLELSAPPEEVANLLALDKLRFELVVEKIKIEIDEDLRFLDYLELITEPNLIHYFLANSIIRGNYVITTNFDYLIEHALMRTLEKKWHEDIIPIITKEDFIFYQEPKRLIDNNKYSIYKIHGSKRNIVTNKDTSDSLITTISALGKEREEGETFAIEPYKKPAIYNLMNQRTLVVMGYSGSDDFDIGPTLKELPFLRRIIWVEHSTRHKLQIKKIESYKNSKKDLPYIEKFLMDISSTEEIDAILIKTHTGNFIETVLWPIFLPHVSISELNLFSSEMHIPLFSEWIKPLYENINLIQKYKLATQLFYFLKQLESTKRCSENSLALANEINDLPAKSYFLNFIGLINQISGNYNKAITHYKEALQIDENLNDFASKAAALNNIGGIYLTWGNYDEALDNYNKALEIAKEIGDFLGKVINLNNIGRVHEIRGDLNQALEKYKESLKIVQEIGDLSQKAAILNNIGMIHSTKQEYEPALEQFTEALKIAELLGDLYGKIILENNIGRIYHETGKFDDALNQYNKTVSIAEQLGDLSKKAGCLNNIGSLYLARGNLDSALEKYQEALHLEERLGDPLMKVIYLNNIGTIYNTQAKYDLAAESYVEALSIAENLGDLSKKAMLITKIGAINMIQGDHWAALDKYEEAILIFGELEEFSNKAASFSNIGKIYEKIENYSKALKAYQEAFQIDDDTEDLMGKASDLYNIGRTYELLNEYRKSIISFEDSLVIFTQLEQNQYAEVIKQNINNLRKKMKSF